jgi:hypothetical protein
MAEAPYFGGEHGMEDTKLKRKFSPNLKEVLVTMKMTARRRDGMALAMALVIVLLGSALVAAMFDLSSAFSQSMTFERRGYAEHVALTDYLEKAKGFIVDFNRQREALGQPVLHGPEVSLDADVKITSLAGLQLTQDDVAAALSVDTVLLLGNGRRRLVMRTYDANYYPSRVDIDDWEEKKNFPPSLKLNRDPENNASNQQKDSDNPRNETPEHWTPLQEQEYRDYGAYVIRVELLRDHNGTELLERDIEEGFFQAINQ